MDASGYIDAGSCDAVSTVAIATRKHPMNKSTISATLAFIATIGSKEVAQFTTTHADTLKTACKRHADGVLTFLSEHFQNNTLSTSADAKAIRTLLQSHKANVKGLSYSILAQHGEAIATIAKEARKSLRLELIGLGHAQCVAKSEAIAAIDAMSVQLNRFNQAHARLSAFESALSAAA